MQITDSYCQKCVDFDVFYRLMDLFRLSNIIEQLNSPILAVKLLKLKKMVYQIVYNMLI